MLKEGQDQRLGSVIQERYRLEAFLARGGMGAVFLCEDLRLAGQKWAIKEMLSASPAEAALVRDSFRREAEMLARLRHPSLPAIVDSFVEGQHHYLVMEYIPGLTLARHIQESGPADQNRATRWGVELAGVLAYLHGQQPPVIFRDLKPENIMVSEGGALKLVDFGLARHFRQGQRRDTQAVGSVGYSPPEQWQDQEQSDQRSDIYGWGAVLHFVLSGKPPSPSYSRQKLREYRPDLNGRLEAVVLKCLEPQPGLRYQTSQDLLRALQGDSGHGEASPKRRRPPWLALAGLLLALLVCLAWWPGARPGRPADPMQLSQLVARSAPLKAALRQKLDSEPPARLLPELQALVQQFPLDGEAHIMANNALALRSGGPAFRIPVITSVSGSEYEGIQMLTGLALAQSEINQSGGVVRSSGRYQLILDVINCDSRQDRTLEAYQQAAARADYALAIGPWSSQQMLLVSPIVESTAFPTIAPTASDPRTTGLGPNSLTVADSDDGRVRALARFFVERGLKRAIVLNNQESVVGHSSAARFRQEFTGLGGSVVAELGYLQETEDYRSILDRVEQVQADCLFIPDYRAGVVRDIVLQLKARGSRLKVGSLAAVYTGTALQDTRGISDLVVCSYFFPEDESAPVHNFVVRYQAFTRSATPSHREAFAYDCLYLVARAIAEVGYDRAQLREYLNSLGRTRPAYLGISGEFTPSRQKESRHAYILEFRNGRLEKLR